MDAARWVRAVRRVQRLSQRELAGMAGVPASTVARIEAGRQNPGAALLGTLVASAGYRLAIVDHKGRILAIDDHRPPDGGDTERHGTGAEHDAVRDRGGRRFPAHLLWGGKPNYWTGDPYWWGWHCIAWYWPTDPAVPEHVYWQRRRRPQYGPQEWLDAT